VSDRDAITRALLEPWDMSPAGMSDTSGSMPYASLDLPALQRAGAVRITEGGGKPSADPNNWSLVSHYNDVQPNSYTRDWQNKPAAYGDAAQAFADPQSGMLYPGKYKQILWSAQKRGMFE
jgi:hypothetical protein